MNPLNKKDVMSAQLSCVVKNRDIRRNSAHSFEQYWDLLIIGTDDDLMLLLPFGVLSTLIVSDPVGGRKYTSNLH